MHERWILKGQDWKGGSDNTDGQKTQIQKIPGSKTRGKKAKAEKTVQIIPFVSLDSWVYEKTEVQKQETQR